MTGTGPPKRTSRLILAALIPLLWVIVMWTVFLLNEHLGLGLKNYGLIPREWAGLLGIFTSPLLHSTIEHIVNNSIPALILGWCLFFFYKEVAVKVLTISWLLTGLLVWFTARTSIHIGASGVVYALAGFLFVSGFLRQHKRLVALSLVVTFLYGGMIWGVLPLSGTGISWESHLLGGLVGAVLALVYRKVGLQKPVYVWPEEEDDEDDPNAPWNQDPNTPRVHRPRRVTVVYHQPGKTPEKLDPGNSDVS